MRPHKAPTLKARRANARRALQQSLPWLPGWPLSKDGLGLHWQPFRLDAVSLPKILTGLDVAAATRFRNATEQWEEDIRNKVVTGLWEIQTGKLLVRLQAALHRNEPLPESAWELYPKEIQRELKSFDLPTLAPLAQALSWWCLPTPLEVLPQLRFLRSHQTLFSQLLPQTSVLQAMQCLLLLPDYPRLSLWLNDSRFWTLSFQAEATRKLAKSAWSLLAAPYLDWEDPKATPIPLAPLLCKVLALAEPHRSRTLALISQALPVDPSSWLEPWERWWQDIAQVNRWKHFARTYQVPDEISPILQRINPTPAPLEISRIFVEAQEISEDPAWETTLAIAQAIEKRAPNLPGFTLLHLISSYSQNDSISPRTLHRLESWFSRSSLSAEAIQRLITPAMLYPLLGESTNEAGLAIFEEMLVAGEAPNQRNLNSLFYLCSVAPRRAREIWHWLKEEPTVWYWALDLALKVEAFDVPGGDIKSLFQRFSEQSRISFTRILKAIPGKARMLGVWLAMNRSSRLELLENALIFSSASPRFPPDVPPVPSWASRFPSSLAPALGRLASIHPDAEAVASRLLSKDFPDPVELERTIRYLEKHQDESPQLAKRLQTLKERLSAPPLKLSSLRQKHLMDKLEHATWFWALESWVAEAEADMTARLQSIVGMELLPEAFLEPRAMLSIAAMAQLSGQSRELGRRLLQLRAGPPPWDFREEPANKAFIAHMQEQGLNLEPWLKGWSKEIEVEGKRIRLELEQDPLEILWMGEHFQSCLSFGGCNFFSVISNIVDINKKVLYGRLDGKVMLRCLLALNDEGGLFQFNLYRHLKADNLETVVGEALDELAAALKTVRRSQGRVSQLVAKEWYDDGVLYGGRDFHEGMERSLLIRLETCPPQELDQLVPLLFGGLPLNVLTAGMLLAFEVVRQRPVLLERLLPFLLSMHPEDERWVQLADALSGRASRWTLLEAIGWKALESEVRILTPGLVESLVERDASKVLKLVRGWSQGRFKAWIIGRCMEKLGRSARALACYKEALGLGGPYRQALQAELVERVRMLEKKV
jgi:hypothetical protein